MGFHLQLPPLWAERLAVQLSADIYLPKSELQAKYPAAVIHEAGCDRVMILKLPDPERMLGANIIWVIYEGTHDLPSLIADLKIKRVDIGCGLEVHEGFHRGVQMLWDNLVESIVSLADSSSRLIWTGHSRGGSMTVEAAAKWENKTNWEPAYFRSPGIYWVLPFAPARLGNAEYRDWYNLRLGSRTFFFHHGADIVPWLPGYLLGNRGVGHRVWFPDPVPTLCPFPSRSHRYRVIDPCLPRLAANLGGLLWDQSLLGLEELLADHHVDTYVKLLTA